jgi:hypothetical protein
MEIITAYDIINTVLAGGLLGVLGQGIRMAIGLKKISDLNQNTTTNGFTQINMARLSLSLFIGFVAGALYLLMNSDSDTVFNKSYIFSIVAAGYSGADFIEGLFSTQISKMGAVVYKKPETTNTPPNNNPTQTNTLPDNEQDNDPT